MSGLDSLARAIAIGESLRHPAAGDTSRVVLLDTVRTFSLNPLPEATAWDRLWPILLGSLLTIVGGFVAQWFKLAQDSRRQKKQMKRRMLHMLQQGLVVARWCRDHNQDESVPDNFMREILAQWEAYDRVSDIALFKSDAQQFGLHMFLERMKMDAETILEGQVSAIRRLEAGKSHATAVIEVFRNFNKGVAIWEELGMGFLRDLVGEKHFPIALENFERQVKARSGAKPGPEV